MGKLRAKIALSFPLTMSWSDIYKFIDEMGSCTSYDLDEPEEAEAVLLEGCEHAEDLTEAVKSSACSHPSRSTASASSSDHRSIDPGYDERTRTRD